MTIHDSLLRRLARQHAGETITIGQLTRELAVLTAAADLYTLNAMSVRHSLRDIPGVEVTGRPIDHAAQLVTFPMEVVAARAA